MPPHIRAIFQRFLRTVPKTQRASYGRFARRHFGVRKSSENTGDLSGFRRRTYRSPPALGCKITRFCLVPWLGFAVQLCSARYLNAFPDLAPALITVNRWAAPEVLVSSYTKRFYFRVMRGLVAVPPRRWPSATVWRQKVRCQTGISEGADGDGFAERWRSWAL